MILLAIDPGPSYTAYVIFGNNSLYSFNKLSNEEVLSRVCNQDVADRIVIEKIASMGMAVGAEVFETCVWTGRFMEAFGAEHCDRITRHQVKINLCGSARAKDANVRQAIIDRFGGPRSIKKGGPLYKVSGDVWSALAVALTWCDLRAQGVVAVREAVTA